jgi:hypothetical protein
MSNKFNTSALAMAISATFSASVWAIEPQSVDLADGVTFTPTLQVSQSYDDNIRAVEDNAESSWVNGIKPTFVLQAQGQQGTYALTYSADNKIYASSHNDDHTDHHLDADADFEFDARNQLKLNAGYDKVEDLASADQNAEPDKYTTSNVGGVYTYGAETARAQIDLGANYQELRYQNTGRLNADKERDTTALNTIGYYSISPMTRVLLEVRHTDYDYLTNTDLNSKNIGLLGGVTWDATAKTTGTIKIGAEQKNFDNSKNDDVSDTMWETGVSWSPRTYSTFNLKTRRGFDEGDDGAEVIKSQSTTISWDHEWLDRLSSEVSYNYTDDQYQGIKRDDKIDTLGLGLTYEMRRWLDIGIGYKYAENDSSAVGESYERNIYAVSFTASL